MVESLNPSWNEGRSTDEGFLQAVSIAELVLERLLLLEKSRQEANRVLEEELEWVKDGILVLSKFLPWKDFVDDGRMDEIYFVIYPSLRGGYMVQCVPPKGKPMEQKRSIPEALRGRMPDEYIKLGHEGITFVHKGGFIASANTLDAAKKFAVYLMG